MLESQLKNWQEHQGTAVASANGFDIIDCQLCRFKHIIPIPSEDELEHAYRHEYYTQEKPLYLERYKEDLDWWDLVYSRRYEILEQHLSETHRRLLDIGSGPGYFLLNGEKRGWQVKGIEPSVQAVVHSRGLGLNVVHGFYSDRTSPGLGTFDAVNMSLVLEHIPEPATLLKTVHRQLNDNGMICIIVPNDFNPFQLLLRDHLGFKPWWVAPPHHINYFDFDSLSNLVTRCGFEVVHKEATFPIDMFLLMGENYIENDELGRACHTKRMNFETAMNRNEANKLLLANLYSAFAQLDLGREVVIFARKVSKS